MNFIGILKCYALGFFGNLTLGPIFVLTFNNAAMYGFIYGFAAALGATVADSILFALGNMGTLSLLINIKIAREFLYLLGAAVLIFIGVISYMKKFDPNVIKKTGHAGVGSFRGSFLKAFFLTAANPLTIGYFAATSFAVFHNQKEALPGNSLIFSSFIVALGTLTVLTLISAISSKIGVAISAHRLKQVSKITGVIFILFGIYLILTFIAEFFRLFSYFGF